MLRCVKDPRLIIVLICFSGSFSRSAVQETPAHKQVSNALWNKQDRARWDIPCENVDLECVVHGEQEYYHMLSRSMFHTLHSILRSPSPTMMLFVIRVVRVEKSPKVHPPHPPTKWTLNSRCEVLRRNERNIVLSAGFVRVLENLESPGVLLWHFPGLESPGKRPLVLESSGNLLNSTKKYEVYGRQ